MSDPGEQPFPIPCTTGFDFQTYDIQHEVGLCFGLIVQGIGIAKGFAGGLTAMRAGEGPSAPRSSRRLAAPRWTASSTRPSTSAAPP